MFGLRFFVAGRAFDDRAVLLHGRGGAAAQARFRFEVCADGIGGGAALGRGAGGDLRVGEDAELGRVGGEVEDLKDAKLEGEFAAGFARRGDGGRSRDRVAEGGEEGGKFPDPEVGVSWRAEDEEGVDFGFARFGRLFVVDGGVFEAGAAPLVDVGVAVGDEVVACGCVLLHVGEFVDEELDEGAKVLPVLGAVVADEGGVEVDIAVEGYAGDVDEGVLGGVVVDRDGGIVGEGAVGGVEEEVLVGIGRGTFN